MYLGFYSSMVVGTYTALTIMNAHPLNMKISEQIWVNTIVALHSWHMPILGLQHTYTT